MNNKIISLILLISGFTFGAGVVDFAALLSTSGDIRQAYGETSEKGESVQSQPPFPKKVRSPASTKSSVSDREPAYVQVTPAQAGQYALPAGKLPASTKPSVSDREPAYVQVTPAQAGQHTFSGLEEASREIICTFIDDENDRSLVPPKTAIAKVFIKTVLPCLEKMKSTYYESLYEARGSRQSTYEHNKLDPCFRNSYKEFTAALCGIEDADTPEEVERKLGLVDQILIRGKMKAIIEPFKPEGKILRGQILYNLIRKSIGSLGLSSSEHKVANFNDYLGKRFNVCSFSKWKAEGMLEEDYEQLGDMLPDTSGRNYFPLEIVNHDDLGIEFGWTIKDKQPTQKDKDGLEKLCSYRYVPIIAIEDGPIRNNYKFVPFTKGTRLEEICQLLCLQLPAKLPTVTATSSGGASSSSG